MRPAAAVLIVGMLISRPSHCADTAADTERLKTLVARLDNSDFEERVRVQGRIEMLVQDKGEGLFRELEKLSARQTDVEVQQRLKNAVTALSSAKLFWTLDLGYCPTHAPAALKSGHMLVQSTGDGIFAIEQKTRQVLWRTTATLLNYPNIVSNEKVLFVADMNKLTAHELESGKVLWSKAISDEETRWHSDLCMNSDGSVLYAISHSGASLAMDASGKVLWQTTIPAGKGMVVAPAIDANTKLLLTGRQGKYACALRLDDGTVAWQRDIPGISDFSSVQDGRVLVVLHDKEINDLASLESSTGNEQWRMTPALKTPVAEKPIHVEFKDRHFTATEMRATSALRWPGDELNLTSAPVIDTDRSMIIVQARSFLLGIDWKTGLQQWAVPCNRNGSARVALHGDAAYAGTDDGRLLAVRIQDGEVLLRQQVTDISDNVLKLSRTANGGVPTPFVGTVGEPLIDGDMAYFTCGAGTMYWVRLPKFWKSR